MSVSAFRTQSTIDVVSLKGCMVPSIRGVCWDPTANRIVIGTSGSEVYEVDNRTGKDAHGGPLIQAHFQAELWGLDTHPSKVTTARVVTRPALCRTRHCFMYSQQNSWHGPFC